MTDGLWKSNQKTVTNYYIAIIVPIVFLISLVVIYIMNKNTKPYTKNLLALLFTLSSTLWLWAYTITKIGEDYPVSEEELEKDKYAQTTQNLYFALYSLAIPLLVLTPLILYGLRSYGIVTWTFQEILYISIICLVIGYAVLGSLYWIHHSIKEANSFPLESLGLKQDRTNNFYNDNWMTFMITLIVFGWSFVAAGGLMLFRYIQRKNIPLWLQNIAILTGLGFLITAIVTGLSYAVSTISPSNNYTVFLTITSFLIFMLLTTSLLPVYYSKFGEPTIVKTISLICGLTALVLSIVNTFGCATQKIVNNTDFENYTNDGTKINDYNENSYDLLNFSMSYNYSALALISFFVCIYLGFELTEATKNKDRFLKLFSFNKDNYKYDKYGFGLTIFGLGILLSSIALSVGQTQGWDKFETDDPGGIALISVGALFSLFSLGEWLLTSDSTFMLKTYHLIILASLVFIPIISFLVYIIKPPRFFTKVEDTDNGLMIFGDINNKNGVPLDKDNQSQFSVSSNFSYYGNGIFFSGGRTNLDLDTSRGIRYISNQSHYYNLKYLYDGNEDFREIEKGNGGNIFSLETNDISYGRKNSGTDAYLVAVGENVGLTEGNNSTIFYNTLAGTNSTEIPTVEDLNSWKKADSNPFDFKGNGVTSGFVGSANRWVAVGQNTVDFSDTTNIKYSNDGKNWTNASGSAFSEYGNKVVFSPSGLKADNTFIAVGTGGNNILRSTDGINWSTTTGDSLFSIEATDVAFGMNTTGTTGIWVAVGRDSSNPIRYSTNDGQTWSNADNTTYSFSKPDDINAVSYNLKDGYFYVVGKETSNGSPVYRSNDGNTWSKYEYDFLEATSVASNLNNAKTNSKFDNIYYPGKDYQKFFIDRVESSSLTSFLIFIYILTFIFMVITLVFMYRKSKAPPLKK